VHVSPPTVVAQLAALVQPDDDLDDDAREELEEELLRQFLLSPEAQGLTDARGCSLVTRYAATFMGSTIATLRPKDLSEIVFDIIPRKVSVGPSAAGWIIGQTRALYRFLKREFALEQADACLAVLGDGAEADLEAALADEGPYDMAKSLVVAGQKAGFDMSTEEGLAAYLEVVNSRPLPGSVFGASKASSRPLDKAAARAKKDKRKAAQKARKRNR
jgi:hypothetical protein